MPRAIVRLAMYLGLFVLAGLPTSAWAVEATLNGVGFDLPEGDWERQDEAGISLLRTWEKDEAADRDEKGVALIQILPATAGGSFAENFAQVLAIFPDLAKDDPIIEREGKTANGHDIRVELRCCTYQKDVRITVTTVGIAGSGLQQFLMLVEMDLHDEDSDAAEDALAGIVRSVRLSNGDRPFALTPQNGAGGLDGVYTTFETGLMPNVFGGLDFIAESRILALDPSGLFSTVIPSGSMAEYCERQPTDCGVYRLSGGGFFSGPDAIEMSEVVDTFGVMETSNEKFSRSRDAIVIGETTYDLVPPLPAGTTFEGTWKYFFASSGMTATGSGGVSVERTLTLHPDGRFSQTGASGYMSSMETGDTTTSVAGSSQKPLESGTYTAEGYHLVLTGRDGRTQTMSLFLPEPDDDELLVIDGNNYLRQDD